MRWLDGCAKLRDREPARLEQVAPNSTPMIGRYAGRDEAYAARSA
jgi:hypothetical protein